MRPVLAGRAPHCTSGPLPSGTAAGRRATGTDTATRRARTSAVSDERSTRPRTLPSSVAMKRRMGSEGGRESPVPEQGGDYRVSAPNVESHTIPDGLKKDCLLFYCPQQEALARKIAADSDGSVELGHISWRRANPPPPPLPPSFQHSLLFAEGHHGSHFLRHTVAQGIDVYETPQRCF